MIGSEFIAILLGMASQAPYLHLALSAQSYAYGVEKFHHHVFLQVMSLYEEVGVIGYHAELFQLGLHQF